MPWIAAAATIGASLFGSSASKKAAKTSADASNYATQQQIALQREQFDRMQQSLAPYSQAGQVGLNSLMDRMKAGGGTYGNQGDMTYTAPGPYKGPAPYKSEVYNPTTYNAPDPYKTPDAYQSKDFSFTPGDYQNSPGFQFQLQRGLDSVNSNMAARGASNSGAAQKSLASFATGLLNQDYNNQRDFAYNKFNNDRTFGYNKAVDERNFGYNKYNNERDFGYNQFANDRAFGYNKFANDRAFGYDQYNNDRNFDYSQYNNDRNFNYGQYVDQRNYLTGRYDNQTNALMDLVGIGQNAAAGVGNAGANYASAAGNAYANNAATIGNAAMANASNISSTMGQAANTLALYYGIRNPSTASSQLWASRNGFPVIGG